MNKDQTPKPPARPVPTDVCRWCLTCTYDTDYCRRLGHWGWINKDYEDALALYVGTYGAAEPPVAAPRASGPEPPKEIAPAVIRPPDARAYLAEIGRRGGQSRSPAKAAAARRNARKLKEAR